MTPTTSILPEPIFSLLYETKNGAGVCKYLSASQVGPALSRLRRPAVLSRKFKRKEIAAMSEKKTAWWPFFEARLALIAELTDEGKSVDEIVPILSVDDCQIRLLIKTIEQRRLDDAYYEGLL